jgi:hypothetical protein
MVINDEELRRRLESPKNLANLIDRSRICTIVSKSSPPTARAPVVVRATAGALAIQSSVPEVAAEFKLSPNSVREATHSRNPEVRSRVDNAIERVRELALDKLMESLGLLTEEKVKKSTARDISVVAANMSRVVENVTPKQIGGNVQLVLYAPSRAASESDFAIVEI